MLYILSITYSMQTHEHKYKWCWNTKIVLGWKLTYGNNLKAAQFHGKPWTVKEMDTATS